MSVRRRTGRIQRIQRMDLPAAFEAWQSGASQAVLPQSVTHCCWKTTICSRQNKAERTQRHRRSNRSLGNPAIGELKFGAQIQRQRLGRTFLLARIPKHPTVTLNERTAKGCPHPFLTRKPNMFWLVVSTPLKNMSSSIEIILHNL